MYRIYRELLITKMGATPIPDLVIATLQSLMLTVNRPIVPIIPSQNLNYQTGEFIIRDLALWLLSLKTIESIVRSIF